MEPLRPTQDDCCNSGCNPCILDVYEQQLDKYLKKRLTTAPTNNCISLTTYTSFKLIKVVRHTHDTFLYTFQHPEATDTRLIYKPGQHFLLKGRYDHKYITKAYTPILAEDSHSFTVLVKLYPDGCMSNYFKSLKVNDATLWRGPHGDYDLEYNHRFMLFIAQGTGIAPLYSVIYDMLHNYDCDTFLKLFLCCRSENDLVLRDQLYDLMSYWNFGYEVFLSKCKSEMLRGKYNETVNLFRLTSVSLLKYFSEVRANEVRVLVCGSEMFISDVVEKIIECGVQPSQIFRF